MTGNERKYIRNIKPAIMALGSVVLVSVAFAGCHMVNGIKEDRNLKKEVVIEAGSKIRIEDFFSDCPMNARFLTDVSEIDTNVPAVYRLSVSYEDELSRDVTLKIEDRTGPEGQAVPQEVYTTGKMPDARTCVEKYHDLSGIAKIEYKNGTPKFTYGGEYSVPVTITDMYGNVTVIKVPFTVLNDRTAPEIEGVHDIETDGKNFDLLDGITVTDDYDKHPFIRVNDSSVDYSRSGEYEIFYSATDKAGNIRNVKAKIVVNVSEDEEAGQEESSRSYYGSDANDLAADIMSSLWRSSDVETARAIFNWVHSNVYYQTTGSFDSIEEAAYRGFTRHSGDCFVSFSCAKMLLDHAGIPNLMVERYPVYNNGHFWNLVYLDGEWYHCDATIYRDHPSMYFMCTDDEIGDSHHEFNGSLYPARAGGSSDYLPAPTPEPSVTPTPSVTPAPSVTTAPEPVVTPEQDHNNEPVSVPEQPAVPEQDKQNDNEDQTPATEASVPSEAAPSEESAVETETTAESEINGQDNTTETDLPA